MLSARSEPVGSLDTPRVPWTESPVIIPSGNQTLSQAYEKASFKIQSSYLGH